MATDGTGTYRILLADDQPMTREGLKLILESRGDLSVIGMARNGLEACELTRELMPDLVLMDIRMPVMDGLASIKRIKLECPGVLILILTTFAEDDYIVEGLASGASGYLLKDMEAERLIDTVYAAASGQFVLQGVIAEKLAGRLRATGTAVAAEPESPAASPRLTEREEQVARLLTQGWGNRDIGRLLDLSDGTVRNYISILYGKLGVSSRGKAIARLLPLFET